MPTRQQVEGECTICTDCALSDALDGKHADAHGLSSLDCGHQFCHSCIFKWLTQCSNTCPLCNAVASTLVQRRRVGGGMGDVETVEHPIDAREVSHTERTRGHVRACDARSRACFAVAVRWYAGAWAAGRLVRGGRGADGGGGGGERSLCRLWSRA
jgi:hypothetical protein